MAQGKALSDLIKSCESLHRSKTIPFSDQFAKLWLRPSTTIEIRQVNKAHEDEVEDFLQGREVENKKTTYYFTGELAGKKLFVTKFCHQDYGGNGYNLDQDEGECEIEWIGFFGSHAKNDYGFILLALLKTMSYIIENLQADRIVLDEWKFEPVLGILDLLGFERKCKHDISKPIIMYYDLRTVQPARINS